MLQAAPADPHLPKETPTSSVGERLVRALESAHSDHGLLRRLGLVMLALAIIFPWFVGSFYTRLGIEALLLGAVALSVDILLGFAGLLSLGQAAYFGLAAYLSSLMYLHVTQSFWLVALTVGIAVAMFSFVFGAIAIRAKGVYFALITFGAAEILPILPKAGQPPKRVLIRAHKGAGEAPRTCRAFVLHKPDGGYTDEAEAVLRHAQALEFV